MEEAEKKDPAQNGIDVHVHLRTGDRRTGADPRLAAGQAYFKRSTQPQGVDEIASLYRKLGFRAVIFDVDAESQTGLRISNDEVAEAVHRYPDIFIGFASVDPWKGEAALKEIRRCATQLGLRGVKFQPISQAFFPNQKRFSPIYELCQELNLITTFHTGTTGIGAGTPGGHGIHLKYGKPIPYIDDVAADFPSLTIIAAHPSWPWQEEMLAVARHKSNVYIDLSGWSPKYFPESLVHYANTLLQDKVMFGSDFPMIDPEGWLKEFANLSIREEVRKKIIHDNAVRLFDSTSKATGT